MLHILDTRTRIASDCGLRQQFAVCRWLASTKRRVGFLISPNLMIDFILSRNIGTDACPSLRTKCDL